MDSSAAIAAVYLQLNGYFVLTELPVQVADRLPHAAELVPGRQAHARDLLLGHDPLLATVAGRTEILVAEVKRGRARINEGNHDVDVLRFALRRTGCCPPETIDAHARALAREGSIETRTADGHPCRTRLASFAGEPAPLGRVVSLGLDHCLEFTRSATYRAQLRGKQELVHAP